jgi:hypothetical protein
MRQGERKMAVITYTVSVVGGAVTLSPTADQITLTTGDFLAFAPDASVAGDIFVQMTGGSNIFVAAAPLSGKMTFQPFQLDADGNVTIAFEDSGGNPVGGGGFPP